MDLRPFLSTFHVTCNPLTCIRENTPCTCEEARGKFSDFLQKYRGFRLRQSRWGGQVTLSSHSALIGTFRLVITTKNSFAIRIPEPTYPFILTLTRLMNRLTCTARQFQLAPHDPLDKHRPCFVKRLP